MLYIKTKKSFHVNRVTHFRGHPVQRGNPEYSPFTLEVVACALSSSIYRHV